MSNFGDLKKNWPSPKELGDFVKFLWLSQNIWTLHKRTGGKEALVPLSSSDTNALYGFGACWAQLGPMAKTNQILDFKKSLNRLIILACNNLTNFSYEANTITGNGNYVIYLKLAWIFLWDYFKQNNLWWILSHLKPVCHRAKGGISSWIGAGLGLVQLYSNVLVLGMEKLGGCWGLVSPVVCSMYEYSAQWKPPPQPPHCAAEWHLPAALSAAAIDVASLGVYTEKWTDSFSSKNTNSNLKSTKGGLISKKFSFWLKKRCQIPIYIPYSPVFSLGG